MFGWLRKLKGARRGGRDTDGTIPRVAHDRPQTRGLGADDEADRRSRVTATQVFDGFYDRHAHDSQFGIHLLCEVGAANLETEQELADVINRIVRHCNVDPISPTLRMNLHDDQLLAYLRWHVANKIEPEEYRHGKSIVELVRRFQAEASSRC